MQTEGAMPTESLLMPEENKPKTVKEKETGEGATGDEGASGEGASGDEGATGDEGASGEEKKGKVIRFNI
jgi:hypothetical protein